MLELLDLVATELQTNVQSRAFCTHQRHVWQCLLEIAPFLVIGKAVSSNLC
jgi:hypothetical protein